ncbi:sialic acid-binding Ig-like lectin 10 isoform X4 [Hemitrygon akajei]|uniref:sialic acid-binding Ig-like lectin 10 isoform X4 n=1 Tax=Hemitrygon akajei TaxID=2704970 RepID=UPI003BF9E975
MSQTPRVRNCKAILDWMMIRELYLLLSLLQDTSAAAEMEVVMPQNVTAQRGLCAQIPCHYTHPSHEASSTRTGIWIHDEKRQTIVFHSKQPQKTAARFRQRTLLSGDLKDGDCSLIIENIMQEDEGSYFFEVVFNSGDSYTSSETRLHVSNESATIWKKVLITTGIVFCIALAGFSIYRYIQKRKEKRAPEIKESTVTYSPPFEIHQDTESTAALGYPKVATGRNIGQGEPTRPEGPLYAQLQDLPCRDTMVPKAEATEYASIRFQ